jgi:hypothetical protein
VDEVFAKLQKSYFDWNEVRVTSVPELAEVMATIPDAVEAAKRMKRALQSVFERHYQFDIEQLRKAGLGKAVEALQKLNGVTPFVIDYMTQNALGGHAIPTNTAGLALLVVLDAVSPADAAKNRVPGLERAIPKNKGPEFASLLHQFAVDFAVNPQASRIKSIVGEIDAAAKERLPKKAPTPPPAPAPVRRVIPPSPVVPGKPPAGEKSELTKPTAVRPPAESTEAMHEEEKAARERIREKPEKDRLEKEKALKPEAGKSSSGRPCGPNPVPSRRTRRRKRPRLPPPDSPGKNRNNRPLPACLAGERG